MRRVLLVVRGGSTWQWRGARGVVLVARLGNGNGNGQCDVVSH
jgi:hypothetical protein